MMLVQFTKSFLITIKQSKNHVMANMNISFFIHYYFLFYFKVDIFFTFIFAFDSSSNEKQNVLVVLSWILV